ncbi:hypothetical protein N0V90_003178 [Kalmusia sp. IMI 367209]|nr:hypothetical protein N0V90_003178 [Kalmusia sp. IMI 367209]
MSASNAASAGLGDPFSASNLLAHTLKRASRISMKQLPTTEHLRKERLVGLLNTPVGRDFKLITSAGVEFAIHATMLIGGPKQLEQVLFPSSQLAFNGERPDNATLPEIYHPLFVDRLVSFLYTSDYSIDDNAIVSTLYHHTALPGGSTPTYFEFPLSPTQFHVCMYGMAELLDYAALKTCAHTKLVQSFVFNTKDAQRVKQLVEVAFEPAESPKRFCTDADGALKELAIVAVLVHEKVYWGNGEKNRFRDAVAKDIISAAYNDFGAWYKRIKDGNAGLLHDAKDAPAKATPPKAAASKTAANKVATLKAISIPNRPALRSNTRSTAPKPKLAQAPGRKFINTPAGLKIVDPGQDENMGMEGVSSVSGKTTGMMGSKHAPKTAQPGVKPVAGAMGGGGVVIEDEDI